MMRSTFFGFETAKTSIFTNQKSLDIVANNLANVNTVGYTRQYVNRASVVVNGTNNRVASNMIPVLGQGVQALGVTQTRDNLLDQRFREEYAQASYHGDMATILSGVQTALGDGFDITNTSGMIGAIQEVYESLYNYMQEPTLDTQATLVYAAFNNICTVINQINTNLENCMTQYTEDLELDVSYVNDLANQIAYLNGVISDEIMNGVSYNDDYGPNELYDARNLLLDELASYGDITVIENVDGSVDVKFGEDYIVQGEEYDQMFVNTDAYGTVWVNWVSSGQQIDIDSGSIMASMEVLNGHGMYASINGQNFSQGIPYYQNMMDTFATGLVQIANTTVPELDEDTGEPRTDINGAIVYKTLLAANTGDGGTKLNGITAGNICLSSEWVDNGANYFIFNKDEYIEEYAQQLAYKLTESTYSFQANGEVFNGTFGEFFISLTSKLGSDVSFHEGRQEAYAIVANAYLDQRDAISGVSSDEETANMLMFQKSYEAASRVMTTMDDLLDIIINRTGRVGL